MLKKILSICGMLALCLGFTINSYATDSKAKDIQYLYVQTAKAADLKPIQNTPNSYTLTLKDVHPQMTCFSDRPSRVIGVVPVKKFIRDWNEPAATETDSFKKDAPNGNLSGVNPANHDLTNILVVLTNPSYDDKEKTLTYTVTKIDSSEKFSPQQLQNVTLLIDYCTSCPR